ncbi:MAG: type II secretion system F family protein [Patescibacteria group bacterium]
MANKQNPKIKKEPFDLAVFLNRISVNDKIFFLDHLRTMVHAGLSLVESLQVLSNESENPKMKKIIGEIKEDTEKGKQFSEVLEKYPKIFPSIYVKMIASGEMSGKLEESLEQIVNQMKKNNELVSSIRGAMVYPAVIVFAITVVAILMVTVVLPKLMSLFSEMNIVLPWTTRLLIGVTDFMSQPLNLILILIFLTVFIFSFLQLLKRSPKFKILIHKINLHLPIFGGVIKQINLARFSLTLSSLLRSTLPIVEAVEITAETCSNKIYQNILKEAAEKIKKGVNLSSVLEENKNLFPPMVTEMIMVGEKTGEIERLLGELSLFYSSEVDKTMKNFSTIIEPAIILVLGLAVAIVASAIIMPMYSMINSF